MDRALNTALIIYYPIFFLISISLQSLLFYLILTKTSKVLQNMRWFLYPSNFFNLATAILASFIQVRTVNNTFSLALLCQGPCKDLGPWYCFHSYNAMFTVALASAIINIHTLYYRMVTVKYSEKVRLRLLIFCFWYVSPVVFAVFTYYPSTDFDVVYSETLQNHPFYDYEPFGKFGGFSNTHHIALSSSTIMLFLLNVLVPSFGYLWRRETLKLLDKSFTSLSKQTILQFKTLISGLLLQLTIPLACYLPVGSFYIYNKYSGSQILIAQYILGMSIALPSILDPILQIYFIMPYRKAVKAMFRFIFNGAAVGNSLRGSLRKLPLPFTRYGPSPQHIIYYPIFFLISLSLQSLLFYLILTKTSKVLRNMRWFLYPSNFVNTAATIMTCFIQARNVTNTRSMALLCQGPCKYLGPAYCYHVYVTSLTTSALNAILNMHTLYYRMVIVKYSSNLKFRTLIFSTWYFFPVFNMVISYIPPIDFDYVYSETLQDHPFYDYEPFRNFGGFANTHHIANTLASFILLFQVIFIPICGVYWRRETLKILDRSFNSLSKQTIMQFKTLIRGLLLQLTIPFACYLPVASLYIYNKYSGSSLLITEYTLGISISLPSILDPILQIYFIMPYRKAVKSMLQCGKPTVGNSQASRQATMSGPHPRRQLQSIILVPNIR